MLPVHHLFDWIRLNSSPNLLCDIWCQTECLRPLWLPLGVISPPCPRWGSNICPLFTALWWKYDTVSHISPGLIVIFLFWSFQRESRAFSWKRNQTGLCSDLADAWTSRLDKQNRSLNERRVCRLPEHAPGCVSCKQTAEAFLWKPFVLFQDPNADPDLIVSTLTHKLLMSRLNSS